ncbi:MAG: Transglycosylase domain [Acidimicrobiales bacterium]|nr:Transglycosylase domain [Acidimicrobiales bacterium]
MPSLPAPSVAAEAAPTSTTRVGRTKVVRRAAVVSAAALGLAVAASACTPEDFARAAIQQQFGSLSGMATKIAMCESRLQPGAVSPGGGNVGLFQINKVHAGWIQRDLGYRWSQMTDANVNARVARVLYHRAGGWSPWHGTCGGKLGI